MATLKIHRQIWQAKVRVPKALEERYGGRQFLYKHLGTSDRRLAKVEADAWEAALRIEWSGLMGRPTSSSALRQLYEQLRRQAEGGEFTVEMAGADPIEAGIEHQLERLADTYGNQTLPPEAEVRLAALQDAALSVQGRDVPKRPELEPSFRELADDYLTLWRTQQGLKETNTEQQKIATYDLFAGFFGAKPIRQVRKADAARFVDTLRQMDPDWARKPAARAMSWAELQRAFGGRTKGLSDATVNRHMGTLQSLWDWAEERDFANGSNPFKGFRRQLKDGRNQHRYVAWEPEELRKLFSPPPKRSDVTEVMLAALYTGMRLDEIVSLTVGQVHKDGPVPFLRVVDAKTPAGNRDVPVHPELGWLLKKAVGRADGRIWPGFRDEGPGKKPGGDAGKEFSRFKASKGFTDRRKVFHSFRKNFVGQLEAARVPESEVAQIVGHEKQGFTFSVYGNAADLKRKAEVVALVSYPGLPVPEEYRGR